MSIQHAELKIDQHAVYSETNEWMRAEEEYFVVGITDYAQAAMRGMATDEHLQSVYVLGSLVVGDTIDAGDVIGECHSSKTSSDIYSPISGTIVAINGAKEHGVYLISTDAIENDPYGTGWLLRIRPSGVVKAMFSPEDYATRSAKEYAEHYGG